MAPFETYIHTNNLKIIKQLYKKSIQVSISRILEKYHYEKKTNQKIDRRRTYIKVGPSRSPFRTSRRPEKNSFVKEQKSTTFGIKNAVLRLIFFTPVSTSLS